LSRLTPPTGRALKLPGGDALTATPPPSDGRRLAVLSEFERLLRERGCPACKYVEHAERSFFSWFEIESFSTVEVHARLREALGMCPAHSRRLVDDIGEGHVMTTVVRQAVSGARRALIDHGQPGSCPACDAVRSASERACHVLLEGLLDAANASLYREHVGICLPHLVQATPSAEPPALAMLAQRLLTSLQDGDAAGRHELLAGIDDDARRRASWRRRLPDAPPAASTLEHVCGLLELPACPVCLSMGRAQRAYLEWFAQHTLAGDRSLRNDPGELCAAHLHDIALADQSVAGHAGERKRAARTSALRRLLDQLSVAPAPARRRRRAGDNDPDRARLEFTTAPYCSACHARDSVERSRLELITASLALAPVRERYQHSHGLCVHHATVAVRNIRRDGVGDEIGEFATQHLDARLGVIGWEVAETSRKSAWGCRHEAAGPERGAWTRALAQVDGRVFEGCPAPIDQHRDTPEQP
jgi:hypothetical protein